MCFPTVTHLLEEQVIKRHRWLNSRLSNNQKRQEMPDLSQKRYINSCALITHAHVLFWIWFIVGLLKSLHYIWQHECWHRVVWWHHKHFCWLYLCSAVTLCVSIFVPVHLCSIDGDRESHTALDLRWVSLSYGGSLSHRSSSPGWWCIVQGDISSSGLSGWDDVQDKQ